MHRVQRLDVCGARSGSLKSPSSFCYEASDAVNETDQSLPVKHTKAISAPPSVWTSRSLVPREFTGTG